MAAMTWPQVLLVAAAAACSMVSSWFVLFRAVTYPAPIPLATIAFLTWRHAPALIRTAAPAAPARDQHRPARGAGQPAEITPAALSRCVEDRVWRSGSAA